MRKNMLLLAAAGASVGLLLAPAPVAVRSAAAQPPPLARSIGASKTLPPGEAVTLYSVSGQRELDVGRFIVSCTRDGLARTSYKNSGILSALIAVDGRGASRGANTTGAVSGGVKPSGIEHWIMSTASKLENIYLDAFLMVISAQTGHGNCYFSLSGKLVTQTH